MPKLDVEKPFLLSLAELQESGEGIAIVRVGYKDPITKEGFREDVPAGLEVRLLGDISEREILPMGEFVVYDPGRVEILIETFRGTDDTDALSRGHALKSEGWTGTTRYYSDHFANVGWRPINQTNPTSPTPVEG